METKNIVLVDTVRDLIRDGEKEKALVLFENLHPHDSADVLEALDLESQVCILSHLSADVAAKALLEMEESSQVEIAASMNTGQLHEVIDSMPADDAVDLLGDISPQRRTTLLRLFRPEDAKELKKLLSYPRESAGGLMTPDFFAVRPAETVNEVIEKMRSASPEIETIYYVYVVDEDDYLLGVFSARDLILARPTSQINEVMNAEVISAYLEMDREQVSDLFEKYELIAVPVVDKAERLAGIVTVDDVLEVMDEEAEEDMIRFVGEVGKDEIGAGGIWSKITARLPWFVLTALLELLIAGGILKLYTPVLERVVALVFFIPLLVIVGGNLAVQAATLMSERLESGNLGVRDTAVAILREVRWGVLLGVVAGGLVVATAAFLEMSLMVGVVVGVSLVVTVLLAAAVGSMLPVLLKALGRDPAIVSEPVIGTLMDVISLGVYLLIGTLLI